MAEPPARRSLEAPHGFAKRLVSRFSSPEGLDGRQSAPARGERTRATALAQNPAQTPEIGCTKSNPLYVHHHIHEAHVHQRIPQNVHVGKWMHSGRRSTSRPREGEFLQCVRPEGAQQHQAAGTQGAQALPQRSVDRVEHGSATFDSMRSMECDESGWRSASPVTYRCLENHRGARDLASCSSARTGSDGHHVGSAKSACEEASGGAGAGAEIEDSVRPNANPVESLEQGVTRDLADPGELRIPVSHSAEHASHPNAVECRPHRLRCRWWLRMNVEYGFANTMRREPAAHTARERCRRHARCSRHIMRTPPTDSGRHPMRFMPSDICMLCDEPCGTIPNLWRRLCPGTPPRARAVRHLRSEYPTSREHVRRVRDPASTGRPHDLCRRLCLTSGLPRRTIEVSSGLARRTYVALPDAPSLESPAWTGSSRSQSHLRGCASAGSTKRWKSHGG